MIILGLLLCLKHFICDAVLQTPYMYKNKGIFSHPGGILHAAFHGAVTAAVVGFYALHLALVLGALDFITHYIIDYSKVNITRTYKWSYIKANELIITSDNYFIALIADQCLHFAIYFIILGVVYG